MKQRLLQLYTGYLVVAAILLWAAFPAAAQSEAASDEAAAEPQTVLFGFDLFPYVGTSSALPDARREVSVNLVAGLSGGIDRAEFGSVLNVTTGTMSGVQLSGVGNWVSADVEGVQFAGSANVATRDLAGIQFAGAGNVVLGTVSGIQWAGAGNVVTGHSNGLQAAGAWNVVTGSVNGLQGAGAANLVVGDSNGIQASGAANIVTEDLNGLQIGVANVTAGEVRGLQLGIFNYAKDSTASIGLLSIVPEGFLEAELFGTVEGLALAGVRHGTERIYNVYYAGSLLTPSGPDFAFGLGLGWRKPLAAAWELNIDTTATQVAIDGNFENANVLTKFRTLASFRVSPAVAVFAGPTVTFHWSENEDDTFDYLEMWSFSHRGNENSAWLGATLGVRLF
jgi:hypothetical protein